MLNSCKRLILGVVVCAAGVGVAADAQQAWINIVDMSAMERALLDYANNLIVLTYSSTQGFSTSRLPRGEKYK